MAPLRVDPVTGETVTTTALPEDGAAAASATTASEPVLEDADGLGPAFNRGLVVEGLSFTRKRLRWTDEAGNLQESYFEQVSFLEGVLAGTVVGILDATGFHATPAPETPPA